jgi:hypothetical protein
LSNSVVEYLALFEKAIKRQQKMKRSLLIIIICVFSISITYGQHKASRLKVSPNDHYLQYEDGTPFFWLGDTGWDLFKKLKKDEIEKYLENRRQKGFNVIQAVILAGNPNKYRDRSFRDHDPLQTVEDYFELVDWSVKKAFEKKMFMALLPTWGDKVTGSRHEPPLFNEANAYKYGLFLGKRYRSDPNVIWVIGGDHPAFTDSADWRPVWRAMAKGLREGAVHPVLICYHPAGESSSTQFWKGGNTLDMNMMQSGHRTHDLPVWSWVRRDYGLMPSKPVLDGEPNYEDHPVNWNPKNGYFRDYDVRKQIYRSVFSGACGVTYGHNSIFQFYEQGDKKINFADRYWTEALDRPGAFQAGYLKKLILSRPPLVRVPDQSLILNGQGKDPAEYITAFRDADDSYAMIYLPIGKKIEINTSLLKAKKIKAWWVDPKTGKIEKSYSFKAKKNQWFTPTTFGKGNDWVLVLDDIRKGYKTPGQ